MCGIVAVFHEQRQAEVEFARRLLTRIRHRGEADKQAEVISSGGCTLGTNRLAILSGEKNAQPIRTASGAVVLVFNGEVYNYRRLVNSCGVGGVVEGGGDGAFVAELLEQEGPECVKDLDGMFAIAWYDGRTGTAYACRDRLGIKPLYYATCKKRLAFASEIKALAPEATVREIFEVPPGSIVSITWNASGVPRVQEVKRYFDLRRDPRAQERNIETLRHEIVQSIGAQLAYKGKIGVYLSAGVDSGGVLCAARTFRSDLTPLALFGNRDGVDGRAARRLTQGLGMELVFDRCPSEEALFGQVFDTIEIVESFEPNVVRQSSVQRYIAKLAVKAGVKVVLCGEGADELFCGYPEFLSATADWQSLRFEFLEDLRRTQLQRVDRMSMHYTTEVRVPYLSNGIIDWALDNRASADYVDPKRGMVGNKLCLRKALGNIAPKWVCDRAKVVLSEGVGLRGNDPETGMFRHLADRTISDAEAKEIIHAFPEWNLRTKEEVVYFKRFDALGYTKARFARRRVRANASHST